MKFEAMDSQQLVETVSQNSQDSIIAKPTSSTPRHSIESILGLVNRKRNLRDMEDSGISTGIILIINKKLLLKNLKNKK